MINFSRSRGIETFLSSTYVVSDQSNRQGLRLEGSAIESRNGRFDIVSDAVVNGSIQVPGEVSRSYCYLTAKRQGLS
ncbi:MAG: hypothetical protein Ct9H300mP19_05240 [Dehalococcoidia bacterium]|nr:MAG: hypothetical protein Ct9H300mP19_05240 [Dehalococcoidia bacterium]